MFMIRAKALRHTHCVPLSEDTMFEFAAHRAAWEALDDNDLALEGHQSRLQALKMQHAIFTLAEMSACGTERPFWTKLLTYCFSALPEATAISAASIDVDIEHGP